MKSKALQLVEEFIEEEKGAASDYKRLMSALRAEGFGYYVEVIEGIAQDEKDHLDILLWLKKEIKRKQ